MGSIPAQGAIFPTVLTPHGIGGMTSILCNLQKATTSCMVVESTRCMYVCTCMYVCMCTVTACMLVILSIKGVTIPWGMSAVVCTDHSGNKSLRVRQVCMDRVAYVV